MKLDPDHIVIPAMGYGLYHFTVQGGGHDVESTANLIQGLVVVAVDHWTKVRCLQPPGQSPRFKMHTVEMAAEQIPLHADLVIVVAVLPVGIHLHHILNIMKVVYFRWYILNHGAAGSYVHGLHAQAKTIYEIVRLVGNPTIPGGILISAQQVIKKRKLKIMAVGVINGSMQVGLLTVNPGWQIGTPKKDHTIRLTEKNAVIITQLILSIKLAWSNRIAKGLQVNFGPFIGKGIQESTGTAVIIALLLVINSNQTKTFKIQHFPFNQFDHHFQIAYRWMGEQKMVLVILGIESMSIVILGVES